MERSGISIEASNYAYNLSHDLERRELAVAPVLVRCQAIHDDVRRRDYPHRPVLRLERCCVGIGNHCLTERQRPGWELDVAVRSGMLELAGSCYAMETEGRHGLGDNNCSGRGDKVEITALVLILRVQHHSAAARERGSDTRSLECLADESSQLLQRRVMVDAHHAITAACPCDEGAGVGGSMPSRPPRA